MKLLPTLTHSYRTMVAKDGSSYQRIIKNTRKMVKQLKELEDIGADVEFEAENETEAPDRDMDENQLKYIREQYENGNEYAWFCAHVKVKFKGWEVDDYLGGCSYKSRKDFIENSGYYLDMVNNCIEQINRGIEDYNNSIKRRWELRKAHNICKRYGYVMFEAKQMYSTKNY